MWAGQANVQDSTGAVDLRQSLESTVADIGNTQVDLGDDYGFQFQSCRYEYECEFKYECPHDMDVHVDKTDTWLDIQII